MSSRRHRKPPILPQRGSSTPTAIFNLPPKKIIKATKSYNASRPGELSFKTGDFFYVIHDRPDEQVYEVINPVEKRRGLVKYKYFANIAKNARESDNRSGRDTDKRSGRETDKRSGRENDKRPGRETDKRPGRENDLFDQRQEPPRGYDRKHDRHEDYENEYPGDEYGSLPEEKGYYDDEYEPSEYYQEERDDYRSREDRNYLDDRNDRDYRDDVVARNDRAVAPRSNPGKPNPESFSKNLQSATPKKFSTDLDSCIVSSCTVQKDRWYFVIHAKYVSGQMDILKRSYDDIWALQVTLLSRFPSEAGRNKQSRLIPLLHPPEKGVKLNRQAETKQELNRYFRDLLFLPPTVLQSTYFLKFFAAKVGDLKNTSLSTDVGDTLLDLLDDIEDSPMISVKVILGDEVISWIEEPGLDYEELMYQCEDRLGFEIDRLLYLDEIENMTELYGDEDLRLLISFSPNLKFFVK